jgi:hypothetical protein
MGSNSLKRRKIQEKACGSGRRKQDDLVGRAANAAELVGNRFSQQMRTSPISFSDKRNKRSPWRRNPRSVEGDATCMRSNACAGRVADLVCKQENVGQRYAGCRGCPAHRDAGSLAQSGIRFGRPIFRGHFAIASKSSPSNIDQSISLGSSKCASSRHCLRLSSTRAP